MRTMPNIRAIRISDPVSQSSSSVSLLGGVIAPFVTFRITSRVIYDHNNHISDEKRITDPHDDGESSTGPGKGRKYTNDENYEILVVRRRFSDFDLLVKCFRASNYAEDASQLVIPPILPIATSPFPHLQHSDDFIRERVVLLQRFIDKTVEHPLLCNHPALWTFIEGERSVFADRVSELRLLPEVEDPLGSSLMSRVFSCRGEDSKTAVSEDILDQRFMRLMEKTADLKIVALEAKNFEQLCEKTNGCLQRLVVAADRCLSDTISSSSMSKMSDFQSLTFKEGHMVEIVADEYRRLIESEVSRVINLRAAKRQKLLDVQIERVEIEASLVRMATVEQSSSNRTDAFDAAYPLAERAQKLKEEEKMLTMWLQTVNMRIREELDRIESTYWDELSNFKDSLIKSIVKRMGIASGTTAT